MGEGAIQRLQERWAEDDARAVDSALATLLATYEGRKYLWWLLQIGKVGQQPFNSNAMNTSFACGELNVGNQILAHIIEVNPAGYVAMMQEQANERSDRDTKLRDAAKRAAGNGNASDDAGEYGADEDR